MTVAEPHVRGGSATQLDRDNPWPGLDSYSESSYAFFSGRTAEAGELLRRILDEPVTVLFGKSGLGKTSLLKAGVFPHLRDRGLLPIFVRLQIRTGPDPLIHQVRHGLFAELDARSIEHPPAREDETLWEYLHRAGLELWTPQNRLVRPVFVFDQFEELFTLGAAAPADVAAFQKNLADLAENRIPAGLAARLELDPAGKAGFDLQAMPYSIVIALREDFLADLEGWRLTMPSLRRNRMRLLPMGTDQALEAVCNERTKHLVTEELGRRIVAFLSSGAGGEDAVTESSRATVEPALLSLFCRGVNEHRKRDGKTMFDEALLEGGKDTIVSDFYKSSLADQPERVRRFIEENLITEHGFRNSYSVEDALARNAVTVTELDTLINRHLLRHEHHLGTERVELTHDLLTTAVVEERDERRRAESAERERRTRWKKVRAVAIASVLLVVPLMALLAYRASSAANRASAAERRANAETARSRSRELGAIAGTTIERDPELAIALAVAGSVLADTAEARSALLDAARYVWPSTTLGKDELKGIPGAVSLSGDGGQLAVLAGETITLWDVTTLKPQLVWQAPDVFADASSVAFSPDQKRIAVGRQSSIAVLDAGSGRIEFERPLSKVWDRLVAFSRDGGWLAWAQNDTAIAILDLGHREKDPAVVITDSFIGFALHAGGGALTTLSGGLQARVLTRQATGNWSPAAVDLSACTRVAQSVSPGTRYLSATWHARKCVYEAGAYHQSPIQLPTGGQPSDVVWSTSGGAYADLLILRDRLVGDLVVGRVEGVGERENRIRSGHRMVQLGDMTRVVAVADSATRLAYIDADEHKLVRIFSLGMHRPFLTGVEPDRFAVSPDGTWFAIARSGKDEKIVVDIVPVDGLFTPGHLSRARARITLDAIPNRLEASSDSVLLELQTEPWTTAVHDAVTGLPRRAAYTGGVRMLGESGGLLLLTSREDGSLRVVKTVDGSEVAALGRVQSLFVSPGGTAVAVMPQDPDGRQVRTTVYSIRGTDLTKVGEVSGLESSQAVLADDGQSLTDNIGRRIYTVVGTDPATAPEPRSYENPPPAVSPTGRLELQFEPVVGEAEAVMTLVARTDSRVVKRFVGSTGHRFSSDDKWLAVWGESGLQIVDTADGKTDLALRYPDVTAVRFLAGNGVLNIRRSSETLLVPLDRELTKRFAAWLTPRILSTREQCLYGLGAEDCR